MHYSVIPSFLLRHGAVCSADRTPMLNPDLPALLSGRGSLDWDQDHFISLVYVSSTARCQPSICMSLKQESEPNWPRGQVAQIEIFLLISPMKMINPIISEIYSFSRVIQYFKLIFLFYKKYFSTPDCSLHLEKLLHYDNKPF